VTESGPNAPELNPNDLEGDHQPVTTDLITSTASIVPTRRLPAKERAVFDKVLTDFIHLAPSDAEQLTQYAEAVVRYRKAEKDTRKDPTISTPIVNRATGNVVGQRTVRNPAFATMRESQAQMNSLARRLMIDATSADKRQRLLTKKARSMAASESASADAQAAIKNLTEEQIQATMDEFRKKYTYTTEAVLRADVMWYLTVAKPLLDDPDGDELIYGSLSSPTTIPKQTE
jgi:phage terminase small subunit